MDKEKIKNLIKELIEKTAVKIQDIIVDDTDSKNVWFAVEVSEPHFFINNDGEALHALNHLVRRILEPKTHLPNEEHVAICIDINGFQKKRVENVKTIAHMMSERARYFKANVEVDPMSAFDRRIVHEFLADATDLKTESVGFGPTRRVVIKYLGTV